MSRGGGGKAARGAPRAARAGLLEVDAGEACAAGGERPQPDIRDPLAAAVATCVSEACLHYCKLHPLPRTGGNYFKRNLTFIT